MGGHWAIDLGLRIGGMDKVDVDELSVDELPYSHRGDPYRKIGKKSSISQLTYRSLAMSPNPICSLLPIECTF